MINLIDDTTTFNFQWEYGNYSKVLQRLAEKKLVVKEVIGEYPVKK